LEFNPLTKENKMEFPRGQGNPKMLPLKEGNKVIGVLIGEPFGWNQHFNPVTKQSLVCSRDDNCPICTDKKEKSSFRFRVNIIVKEDGMAVAKYLEQGWSLWCKLGEKAEELKANDKKLEQYVVEIRRSGLKTYMVVLKNEMTAEQVNALSALPLNDLQANLNMISPSLAPIQTDIQDESPESEMEPAFEEEDIIF